MGTVSTTVTEVSIQNMRACQKNRAGDNEENFVFIGHEIPSDHDQRQTGREDYKAGPAPVQTIAPGKTAQRERNGKGEENLLVSTINEKA
jgi:hypothetical protein